MENKLLNDYLNDNKKKPINIKKIVSKLLICLILLFGSLIFTKYSNDNKLLYKKVVFDNTFDFMNFKKIYTNYFAKTIPTDQIVFKETIEYSKINTFKEGEELSIQKDSIIKNISGGIVIFVGEKEGYNKTIIIQGSDGYDIWYGNLTNIDVKIYDYINENSIIGSASDKMYLVITKDGKYYKYQDYLNA